ncbi:MAG: hypothetical protein AAB803_01205, partial [Patescibacteria group bacterium]
GTGGGGPGCAAARAAAALVRQASAFTKNHLWRMLPLQRALVTRLTDRAAREEMISSLKSWWLDRTRMDRIKFDDSGGMPPERRFLLRLAIAMLGLSGYSQFTDCDVTPGEMFILKTISVLGTKVPSEAYSNYVNKKCNLHTTSGQFTEPSVGRLVAYIGKEFVREHLSPSCQLLAYATFHDIDQGQVSRDWAENLWAIGNGEGACYKIIGESSGSSFDLTSLSEEEISKWFLNTTADNTMTYVLRDSGLAAVLKVNPGDPVLTVESVPNTAQITSLSTEEIYEKSFLFTIMRLGSFGYPDSVKINGKSLPGFEEEIAAAGNVWICESKGLLTTVISPFDEKACETAIRPPRTFDLSKSIYQNYPEGYSNDFMNAVHFYLFSNNAPKFPAQYLPIEAVSRDSKGNLVVIRVNPAILWYDTLREYYKKQLDEQGIHTVIGFTDPTYSYYMDAALSRKRNRDNAEEVIHLLEEQIPDSYYLVIPNQQ